MPNNQKEEPELADYWRIIWKRKWIVILSLIVVTVSALIFSFLQTPIYEASTTLYLKKAKTGTAQMDIFGGTSLLSAETEINTQIEILKSYTIMEEVARRLSSSVNPPETDKKTHFYEYLKSLIGRIPFKPLQDWIAPTSNKSNSFEEEKPKTLYGVATELRGSISVSPVSNTRLITVTASSTNPDMAQLIANTTADVFIKRDISSRRRETTAALDFLSRETKRVEEELRQSEEALKNYKEKEGFSELSEKAKLMVQRLSETESDYQSVKISRGEISNRLKEIRNQLKKVSKTQISSTYISDNPVVQMLRSQLTNLEIKYAQLSREFSAKDPQIIHMNAQIEETKKEMQRQVGTVVSGKTESINPLYTNLYNKLINYETDINVLKAKEDALGSLTAEYEKEVSKLPEQELKLARLERNQQVNAELYTMLLQSKNKAEIESASEIGTIEVIDPALKPSSPVKPRKKFNTLLGLISGLVIGAAFAFVLEYADKTIKTEDEAKQLLNLPVLGVIPRPGSHGGYGYKYSYGYGKNDKKENKKQIERVISQEKEVPLELITKDLPWSSISEAYRGLRTNLTFVNIDKKLKTIAITSSVPLEGKTSVTTNSGITLASAKEKVLLVDADLRNPGLHKTFLFNEAPGLTDILTTDKNYKHIIHSVDKIENLYLLTSGSEAPNPSELLMSERMKNLILELQEEYDRVLFDLPPILGMADALILSSNVDGTLLIVSANEVDRDVVLKAKESLQKVKACILGIVLNKVRFERHGYGSYYYYPYYSGKKNGK